MAVDRSCAGCRFFHPISEIEGACRRYPPITDGSSTSFPITLGEWDCGEQMPNNRKKVK